MNWMNEMAVFVVVHSDQILQEPTGLQTKLFVLVNDEDDNDRTILWRVLHRVVKL